MLPIFLAALAASASPSTDNVYLPSRAYPAAAEKEIDAAKSSVKLYLYLFSYFPARPDSAPARLARALVRAQKRGVRVEVVLDRDGDSGDPAEGPAKNSNALDFLRSGGVAAYTSGGPAAPLHAKLLVIDEETVLLGSANWSASAFSRNSEADVLLRSAATAQAVLRDFDALPRDPLPTPPVPGNDTLVPAQFLTHPDALGTMVNREDERSFDTELFLLRQGTAGPFTVDEEALARSLALPGPTRVIDRSQIHRVLVRLRDVYKVIELHEKFGKDPVVRLLDLPANETISTAPVRLPAAYAAFGWDRRLTFAGKVFTLLSLHYSAVSPLSPHWSFGEDTLAQRHRVSSSFLSQGIVDLRRNGLLAVRYGELPIKVIDPRPASVYTPLPFYNPADLEAKFQSLAAQYGPDQVARTRQIVTLLYDDSNAAAVEELIQLEKRVGSAVVDKAVSILGAKNPDNPKRCVGYLINTIKNLTP